MLVWGVFLRSAGPGSFRAQASFSEALDQRLVGCVEDLEFVVYRVGRPFSGQTGNMHASEGSFAERKEIENEGIVWL